MNLFSSRKKAKRYLVFLYVISFSMGMLANDSIPKTDFLKYCKNADAYLQYSYTDVSYIRIWGSYKRRIAISNKLVVNNRAGVDKYAYLNLTKFISNRVEEISVKTLKADGSVIELDSSLVFRKKSGNKKIGDISYPIPGVEPGDTIETFYRYSEYVKKHEMTDFVSLYANVPSLNSEYSIKSAPDLLVRYKGYNNFPEPQVVSNDTLIYCVFKMEKLKDLEENQNTCLPCELPYLYYSMEDNDSEPRTWKDVYNQEFNIITQPISFDYQNSSYYRRWKKNVIGNAKDSSKYYKFNLLHDDILKNMQMEAVKREELLKSNGFFLKEKRLNPHSIRRLFRQLLEDLEIEYWAVFARSKRAGRIDPYYIRKGEFDHVFFTYKNQKGTMNLLYPHEEYYKYEINEIPTSIYNTEAVIAKPYFTKKIKKRDKFIDRDLELAEVDSVTVNMIKLPGTSASQNYVRQIFYSDVNLEKKETPLKYKFSVSGGLYTDLKGFIELLAKDEEVSDYYDALAEYEGNDDVVQIDTITETSFKHKKPFAYTMYAKGILKDAVSFLNDSIVSISLEKIIKHNEIESEQEKMDLGYYLDYSYTDYVMAIFDFPGKVEILDIDGYGADLKNNFGEYFFKLNVVDGNQVSFQSNYKISKDKVPKEKYDQLKEINQQVKALKNRRIIVKIKNQ